MNKILSTPELAEITGHSQYDLRLGAKEGRYPVIWIGSKNSKRRRMGWNLEVFLEVEQQQMMKNCDAGAE